MIDYKGMTCEPRSSSRSMGEQALIPKSKSDHIGYQKQAFKIINIHTRVLISDRCCCQEYTIYNLSIASEN